MNYVRRRAREFAVGGTIAVGTAANGDALHAQETLTYYDAVNMAANLGKSFHRERHVTTQQVRKLMTDPERAHRMMVWMAPEKDGGDLERKRRLEEFEGVQLPKSLLRYPVKYDDDWIDGPNFHPKGCDARLPPIWPGAEFLNRYQVTQLYLQKAQQRGVESTNSPTWKLYGGALQILSEELRHHYTRGELWNADARKAFDDWNAKHPKGDKGKWLLDRFDECMHKNVLPKIEETLTIHKEGSENYRKNSKIPLKRPLGPMLRRDVPAPESIAVVNLWKTNE